MEWIVAAAFIIFMGGILWISIEAITHDSKPRISKKKN
jgi:hypothetical protein